jgi:cyclic pyranopterin phosphate synthase
MKDAHGREIDYLRLSITDRCNLRCIYCMPDGGVELVGHEDLLSFEEIERIVRILIETVGIKKIRITGGEPLLRRDLPTLIRLIADLAPQELVLTTNGLLLPTLAGALAEAGLQRVNISLDSLRNEVLASICRGSATVESVELAVRASIDAGLVPVRINTVLLPGVNDREIAEFILWGDEKGAQVRFIELMPGSARRSDVISKIVHAASALGEVCELPQAPGELQQTFRILDTELTFGVIAPLSEAGFCSRCRRIRLTSTGDLVPCLGSRYSVGLRGMLRSGVSAGEIGRVVREAVEAKPEGHSGCEGIRMWRTGG